MKVNKSSGRRENVTFWYEGKIVERVNTYIYLGVPIAGSALFSQATAHMVNKTNMATGSVLTVLAKGKINSWEAHK